MMRPYPPDPVAVAMAHAALHQRADFFFFNPQDVNVADGTINGQFYEDCGWTRRLTPLPDVVENNPVMSVPSDVWEMLVRRSRITTPPLGGKLNIDQRLRQAGLFPDLLIPTSPLGSADELVRKIEVHGQVIVKPVYGSKGRSVMYFEARQDGYRGNFRGRNWILSEEGLRRLHANQLCSEPYLVQKFIRSVTRAGLPFDIRLHIRRNRRADWHLVGGWARIGAGHTVTSNTATGGSYCRSLPFLQARFGSERGAEMEASLADLAYRFSAAFQGLYDDRAIDALGLDIGLDEAGKPWLFEVNNFPGAEGCEIEDAVPRIGYAIYLARHPDRLDGVVRK
jgi:hypothetical protein